MARHRGAVMSGSMAANIAIPIIAFLAVAGWVSLVLYASFHPGWKHRSPPPRTEAGGVFLAVDGGRQLMPIPGETPPEIPLPRTAAREESYQTADAGPGGPASSEDAARRADQSTGPPSG